MEESRDERLVRVDARLLRHDPASDRRADGVLPELLFREPEPAVHALDRRGHDKAPNGVEPHSHDGGLDRGDGTIAAVEGRIGDPQDPPRQRGIGLDDPLQVRRAHLRVADELADSVGDRRHRRKLAHRRDQFFNRLSHLLSSSIVIGQSSIVQGNCSPSD